MNRIAIIGAGCVGSVIAERLWRYGKNIQISFIAFGTIAEYLNKMGVKVNGELIDVPIFKEGSQSPDLVFVCVKNFHLEHACKDLRRVVDDHTILLPLLNSVSPTPTISQFFPNNRVLYGYITKIDSQMDANGSFNYHIAGDIHFGDKENNTIDEKLLEIREILRNSGFVAEVDKDMLRGVWRKWMLNVGANQVSALTEANYLQFAKIPEVKEVLRLAMQELLTIAGYEGVDLGNRDIAEILDYLTTYPFPKQTSMLQDILAKRRTEVDYISGDIIRLSHKWNCPCPVNLTMYYLIKSKQDVYLNKII